MVVNTNILALNSHRALKNVGDRLSVASSRLSSGLRVNSAADDAAGLAISEKMRAQIRGMEMSFRNTQDAMSLINVAEGGMQEITNMLQRIRELIDFAANDTNENSADSTGDRQKIQDEIDQLIAEIDATSRRVEFNGKTLLDGRYADLRAMQSAAQENLDRARLELSTNSARVVTLGNQLAADQAALNAIQANLRVALGVFEGQQATFTAAQM